MAGKKYLQDIHAGVRRNCLIGINKNNLWSKLVWFVGVTLRCGKRPRTEFWTRIRSSGRLANGKCRSTERMESRDQMEWSSDKFLGECVCFIGVRVRGVWWHLQTQFVTTKEVQRVIKRQYKQNSRRTLREKGASETYENVNCWWKLQLT